MKYLFYVYNQDFMSNLLITKLKRRPSRDSLCLHQKVYSLLYCFWLSIFLSGLKSLLFILPFVGGFWGVFPPQYCKQFYLFNNKSS